MTTIIHTRLLPDNTGLAFIPGVILLGMLANESIVAHELRHKEQQSRDGWLWWTLRYVFSIAARIEYEAEAYAVSALKKCERYQWLCNPHEVVANEADNLRHYNAWLFWKPSRGYAAERIQHYFELENAK